MDLPHPADRICSAASGGAVSGTRSGALGGGLLPEFTRLTPYARWWEVPLRTLIACALSWVWLWTEGTALQILLALLLWFCIGWALCLLLRLRKVKTSQL